MTVFLDFEFRQEQFCQSLGVEPCPSPWHLDLELGAGVEAEAFPLNGCRGRSGEHDSGWRLWVGAREPAPDESYEAVNVDHLRELCPRALAYFALPPGWRFRLHESFDDIWFDPVLAAGK